MNLGQWLITRRPLFRFNVFHPCLIARFAFAMDRHDRAADVLCFALLVVALLWR